MTNTIKLSGCSPIPLANYLKALGILRLVAEQADPTVRGVWQDESFVLNTSLSAEELVEFFLTTYQPSPIVSPWNGGSGFLKNDKRVAPLLRHFETSSLPRLIRYQEGIKAARSLCKALSLAKQIEVEVKAESNQIKDKTAKERLRNDPEYKARLSSAQRNLKRIKDEFIPQCRLHWRGPVLEWLEAALIIKSDLSQAFPSLLGTGGNDGNLDFTANFRECFASLFDVASGNPSVIAAPLLQSALFAAPSLGGSDRSIGQFAPANAGGINSSSSFEGKSSVNPWDLILFLEGSILFSSAATRRLNQSTGASAPFAMYAQAAGHISASSGDKASRGEQWMPLWSQPATIGEIRSLLAEGRTQLGRNSTRDPQEMARAIARLGVARGITAFERYGYLERNGQSNFAVPLGRWQVTSQPHQELLADIDRFCIRLRRESNSRTATGALITATRNLDNAIMAAAAKGGLPLAWQNILFALSEVEALLAKLPVDKNKVGIIPALSPGWVAAANDATPEFRLALALGTQFGIRRHFLPLNRRDKLDDTCAASVVCFGRDLISDAIAFISRRIIESASDVIPGFEQYSPAPASLSDIAAFLQGGLNEDRLLALARAFMALKTHDAKLPYTPTSDSDIPEDAYTLFRLAFSPRKSDPAVPLRASIFRRLSIGDATAATREAAQHLRAHGLATPIAMAAGQGQRLAAALAFPISRTSREVLLSQFTLAQ